MFFSLTKEINRLVSKGMSNIYLKVTVEKNWHYQNFRYSKFLQVSFWLKLTQISLNFQTSLLQLKKLEVWEQNCVNFLLF